VIPWKPSDASGAPVEAVPWSPTYVDKAAVTAPPPGAAPALAGREVRVVNAEGKHFTVDASYLPKLKAEGYHEATAQDLAVKKHVDENAGLSGALDVGGEAFLDAVTFGVWGKARDWERKTGGLDGPGAVDPFAMAKWAALKHEHQTASTVGTLGGLGASMVVGGPLFKAAAKLGGAAEAAVLGTKGVAAAEAVSQGAVRAEYAYRLAEAGATAAEVAGAQAVPGFLRTVAAGATRTAVEGAVLAAPGAMTEAILGDPDRAAEALLFGAGVGGALGAGMAGLGYVGKRIGSGIARRLSGGEGGAVAAAEAEKATIAGVDSPSKSWVSKQADDLANKQAFRAMANNSASLGKIIKDEAIQATEVGAFARENALVRKIGESAEDYAQRIGAFNSAAGAEIGAFWKQPALAGSAMDAAPVLGRVEAMMAKLRGTPGFEDIAASLESKWVASFRRESGALGGKVDFATAHEWRQALDDLAYREARAASPFVKELRAVRAIYSEEMVSQAEAAAKSVSPGFAADLKALNRKYRYSSAIKGGVDDYVMREAKNRVLSPTDNLWGAAGGIAGAMMGGPVGILAAGASAIGHHLVRTEGNAVAAAVLDGIATGRGLRVLESSFAGHFDRLQRIPTALRAMGEGRISALEPRLMSGGSVISRLLSDTGDPPKLSKPADAVKFADGLATLANRPEEMSARIMDLTGAVSADAPAVAQSATLKAGQIATYILAARPVSPEVSSPFARDVWKPSDQQMRDFHTKVKTALDPYEAIHALEDKTLSAAHMDALQATAPKMYAEFVRRVGEFAASPEAAPIPYAYRLKLSMLTGAPLDRTVANLAGFQAVFQGEDLAAKASGGAPKVPEGVVTDVDRISG
jgi:hypothetical protein